MTKLGQQFLALSPKQKRAVHLWLGECALAKWDAYVMARGKMRYIETVCATRQTVDATLPRDALVSARQGRDIANVEERYGEPIVAMQDDDLEFQDSAEFAYYSLYNLFRKYVALEDIDDWLIVNQALSSETDETQWSVLLEAAIRRGKEGAS
jgi:hypothetical protein